MVVTSPTYLLDNSYAYLPRQYRGLEFTESVNNLSSSNVCGEGKSLEVDSNFVVGDESSLYRYIHHMDLYRLPNNCDVSVLAIPDIFPSSISLLEWPERILDQINQSGFVNPNNRVDVNIQVISPSAMMPDSLPHVEYDKRTSQKVLVSSSCSNTIPAIVDEDKDGKGISHGSDRKIEEYRRVTFKSYGVRWMKLFDELRCLQNKLL